MMRPDEAIELWSGDERELAPGLTLLRLGGHFAGGTVLHHSASSTLLSGDIVMVIPDLAVRRAPCGATRIVSRCELGGRGIAARLESWQFDRILGAWWDRLAPRDGNEVVRRSAARYAAAGSVTWPGGRVGSDRRGEASAFSDSFRFRSSRDHWKPSAFSACRLSRASSAAIGRAAPAPPRTAGRASLSRPLRRFYRGAQRHELLPATDDGDIGTEPLECSGTGLEGVDASCRSELGEGDARELRRGIGKTASRTPSACNPRSAPLTSAAGRRYPWCPILCIALQQRPPVAGAARIEPRRPRLRRDPRAGLRRVDTREASSMDRPRTGPYPRYSELNRDRSSGHSLPDQDADRDADAVDRRVVERRSDSSAFDKVLVQLVGSGVGDARRRRPEAPRAKRASVARR